jgi:hypothetical protein
MDCPQCGTALTTYALRGHEALVCERCGYVGIEADHHGTPREVESWHDALRRFYDESGVDSDPHVPVHPDWPDGGRASGAAETESTAAGDRPDPRSAPDGVPAIRRIDGDGGDADGDVAEGGERGTDEDGSAVGDGIQSSAGES